MVGEDDDVTGFRQPATELRDALEERYANSDRAAIELVPGMEHALADEPGDPAGDTDSGRVEGRSPGCAMVPPPPDR